MSSTRRLTGTAIASPAWHSDAPDLGEVRHRLEADPKLLALGPDAVLYAVLDAVVDGYAPVVAGLQNDIDEIETQVFDRDPGVSRRICELSREVIEFQRAVRPLLAVLRGLTGNAQEEICAWAAILFAPTLVGTIYGMNFDNMPELHWTFGYPLALSLMGMVCLILYLVFKKRGWL